MLVPRALTPLLHETLADTRVAAILGPRQAGKSTLARTLLDGHGFKSYTTLDDQVCSNSSSSFASCAPGHGI